MSEMTDLMTRRLFLDVCMGIEGICADMYHYYSRIFEDIPEASRLWKKTALEEECHRKQFELASFLLKETEYDVSRDSLKRAFIVQHVLLKHMAHIKDNKPDLLTAVSKAVEMEEKLADLHVHTSLSFKEEPMQNLFRSLSESDCDHVVALQRYRTTLHHPIARREVNE